MKLIKKFSSNMSSKGKNDKAYQSFDKEIFSHKDENNFKLFTQKRSLENTVLSLALNMYHCPFARRDVLFSTFCYLYIYILLLCTVTHMQLLEDFIYPCRAFKKKNNHNANNN